MLCLLWVFTANEQTKYYGGHRHMHFVSKILHSILSIYNNFLPFSACLVAMKIRKKTFLAIKLLINVAYERSSNDYLVALLGRGRSRARLSNRPIFNTQSFAEYKMGIRAVVAPYRGSLVPTGVF